jgi:hypothetical protein
LFSFSSSFKTTEQTQDGNSRLTSTLFPLEKNEFCHFVGMLISRNLLPALVQGAYDDFHYHCGGLPREAATFCQPRSRFGLLSIWYKLGGTFLREKRDFNLKFTTSISHGFFRKRTGWTREFWRSIYIFAARVLMGEKMYDVPTSCVDYRLVVLDDTYRMMCSAAKLALINGFDIDTARKAIQRFRSDVSVRWRGLELAFDYYFWKSIVSDNDYTMRLRCTDLLGKNAKTVFARLDSIITIHRTDIPKAASLLFCTLVVCPANQEFSDY